MPLSLDYANCMSDRVGEHGLPADELRRAAVDLDRLTDQLGQTRGTGDQRWRLLPFDPLRSEHTSAIDRMVKKLLAETEQLLVLGIGGSALGNIALQAALNPPTYNLMDRAHRGGPRLFVLDNVDPHLIAAVLQEVGRDDPGLRHTVVNVISKSGETAETAAQFIVARSMLEAALGPDHARRIVAITDPRQGTMRAICDAQGYATLPVPDGVGGRFSVLSPVGLFSAAMCGIDIEGLLDGAAEMDTRCAAGAMENPAAILAWLLVEQYRRGRTNHVLMPYCNALTGVADWFRQLWAESLGKRNRLDGVQECTGPTPITALGATDQHSQVQLYREGPNDKVIGLLEVQTWDADVEVPGGLDAGPAEPLRYLAGSTLGTLLAAEMRATRYALTESQRPNFTIALPRLDARHVGQLLQLWEVTTAYAGLMLGVNAYDQPAVETGKLATFGLMGRPGYEQWKAKVDQVSGETEWVV